MEWLAEERQVPLLQGEHTPYWPTAGILPVHCSHHAPAAAARSGPAWGPPSAAAQAHQRPKAPPAHLRRGGAASQEARARLQICSLRAQAHAFRMRPIQAALRMLTVLRLRCSIKQHRCQGLLHPCQRCGELVVALSGPLRHLSHQRRSLQQAQARQAPAGQAPADIARPRCPVGPAATESPRRGLPSGPLPRPACGPPGT